MTAQRNSHQTTDQIELSALRSLKELPPLRFEWDRLTVADKRNGMFRGYAWNVLWLQHFAPQAKPHILKLSAKSGELMGLASFCETTYRDRFFQHPALGFTG